MRHGVCKSFQFSVGGFQLRGALQQFLVETADFFFAVLAFRNVVVRLQHARRALLFVAAQGPSARDNYFTFIRLCMPELAFPASRPKQLRVNVIERSRKNRVEKFMRSLSDRLLRRPPV